MGELDASTTVSGGTHQDVARIAPGADEFIAAAMGALLDAVLVFDTDGVIRYANPQCARLAGRRVGTLVGQRVRALIPPELRDDHIERLEQYAQSPLPQRLGERAVVNLRRPEGTTLPIEFSLAPFDTPGGRYVVSVLRPVAEASTRTGTERYLEMSERAALMGSWDEDGRTGTVTWSPGMYRLLGLPDRSAPAATSTFLDRIHPDDLSAFLERREPGRTQGGEWFAEARLAVGPARDRWIAVSVLAFVEVDAAGQVLRSTGTVQDVSARVVLEARLHAGNAILQKAFDNAPTGVALVDARPGHPPRRLIANRALSELTGLSIPRLLDEPVLEVVHPDDRAHYGEVFRQVSTGEIDTVTGVQTRIVRPDGTQRWISTNASLNRDQDGTPEYVIAHIRDITDSVQRAERERARAERDARIANILQDSLRPDVPRRVGPVTVAHRYVAAGAGEFVGGDWTDVFALPASRIGIVVGDVAGHGIEAAATMNRLRALVRMLATSGTSPAAVMCRLNDFMHETALRADIDLATIVHAQLDPITGRMVYCSAGHLPLLVLPSGREHRRRIATPVPAVGGPPIGVVPDLRYVEGALAVEPGSILIGYTDGLVERRGADLDASLLGLRDGIDALPSETLTDPEALADAVLAQSPPDGAVDDVALIVVAFDASAHRSTFQDDCTHRPADHQHGGDGPG